MRLGQFARDASGRLARSAVGAVIALLAGAALEARWAEDGSAPFGATWSASAALLGPLGLLVGLAVGLGTVVLWPSREPSAHGFFVSLREVAAGRHADVAAFVPLVVVSTVLWMTASAQAARALLAVPCSPLVCGIAIAATAVGLAILALFASLAATPPLRLLLARASDWDRRFVDPVATGIVGLVVGASIIGVGVLSGTVSGEGGFFGIYGVFKRPELDLRAPLLLLGAAMLALAAQAQKRLYAPMCAALALAPIGWTVREATQMNEAPLVVGSLERGAPLTRIALGPARRFADRDGDGFAGLFGGGDCDDRDAARNPEADEIVGNGFDEDCSGADLTEEAVAAYVPPPPPPVAVAVKEEKIPQDLNVVLITVDTLRYDLGYAGYSRPISPNIDALAARSVVFERAYSLASYTGKSIGPMLIGKYGSETHRNWGHFNKFGGSDTFLSERLAKAGVRTLAVHGHRYFGVLAETDPNTGKEIFGPAKGFDVVDLSAAPPPEAKWDVDSRATSKLLSDAAIELLGKPEHTAGRFFLWIHYLDPHADYLTHDGVPDFGSKERDKYDGEIAFTDKHVGRVLDAIAAAPWSNRTAIVFSSDHGEAFGEHGMTRHGFEVWEPLVRVPLIVHVPKLPPARIQARRSLVDLVPTVLDLMRIPLPEPTDADESDFVSGISWLADLILEQGASAAERDVLIDMPGGPYNDSRRALIHGDLKLIVSNEARFELFDLASDPDERRRLSEVGEMKDRYAAWKARLREVKVTGKRK